MEFSLGCALLLLVHAQSVISSPWLSKQEIRKSRKKIKPPLYIQEHSSGNEATVTSWPLALAKLFRRRAIEILPGLTHVVTKESFPNRV